MEKKYDFNQIPPSWKFCFNSQCSMKAECLRYQSALEIPDDRLWGSAVFPSALKDGYCQFFRKDEKVTLATGFVVGGNPQMSERFKMMRHTLTNYLGGNGTYYLYRNGKKWLSPCQQEDIRRLFHSAGYTGEVIFSTYKESFDFSLYTYLHTYTKYFTALIISYLCAFLAYIFPTLAYTFDEIELLSQQMSLLDNITRLL